jgi:hypothetical protein
MGDNKAKSIEEFHSDRKRILSGEKFEDTSSPIRTFISFLSCLHFKDGEAMKRIQKGGEWTEEMMEEWDEYMSQIDVLHAPISPDHPEQCQIWPVYLKDASIGEFVDTHLFGYWN